ncbi:thiamine biosynthesis protein ThiS [Sphingobacterium spiritivorum ATCC 33300]|uniref:Thiamine biosynthesis protein ThiS n=2 Tax=Sphingobacterium spiritivorum TaxID=258 RepID=A0A380CNM3_SPHSI|nr:sulfur carrier protein ThiS [Sphingobacterium spiritivorum]EEI92922.1 thiamine biosynthesis protein ThiS [Sphingobacterium spiritivorum ATCC 33300]QQS96274.1 sulfur carrier protein ThiS [Sphingobacterium spiritivorum]SUJ24851.1 Thiamine biosynthesis protein ThiS [Sphingobacterium spiritivorum]
MNFTLNGQTKPLLSSLTLKQLLDQEIPDKQTGIAVAINDQVIPKDQWTGHAILSNDNILIFTAAQGG